MATSNWTSSFETEDGSVLCLVTGEACTFQAPSLSCISCGRVPLVHQKGGFSKTDAVPCKVDGLCSFDATVCTKCGNNKPHAQTELKGTFTVTLDDHLYANEVEFDVRLFLHCY